MNDLSCSATASRTSIHSDVEQFLDDRELRPGEEHPGLLEQFADRADDVAAGDPVVGDAHLGGPGAGGAEPGEVVVVAGLEAPAGEGDDSQRGTAGR